MLDGTQYTSSEDLFVNGRHGSILVRIIESIAGIDRP